jgi:hypothetical protein
MTRPFCNCGVKMRRIAAPTDVGAALPATVMTPLRETVVPAASLPVIGSVTLRPELTSVFCVIAYSVMVVLTPPIANTSSDTRARMA